MNTVTLVTYDTTTKVSLHMRCGTFRKIFDGAYEAAAYCVENEINLKHHINNQPAPRK